MECIITRKEELASVYWDFYKDVHNVRPRWINFDTCSVADLELLISELEKEAVQVFAQRDKEEKAAIVKFEARVAELLTIGAKNRVTALRWIMEAVGCNDDWEFLCWEHGLPYGYFNNPTE